MSTEPAAAFPTERRERPRPTGLRWLLNPVYSALRWVAGHVRGFYAAVGVFLIFGLAVALTSLGIFALLTQVVAAGVVQSFDDAIVIGARRLESPILDALALIGAVLGSGAAAWVIIGAGTIFLWGTHHHYSVYLLWVSLGGARLMNGVLKDWFARPRPAFAEGDIDMLG